MIIDRTAAVTPNRFVDRHLRQEIGRLIGKADRDVMLRTYLWVSECQIAQTISNEWAYHVDQVGREVREAAARKSATARPTFMGLGRTYDQVTAGCHRASSELVAVLQAESTEAKQAQKECADVLNELGSQLGQPLPYGSPVVDPAGVPLLDALAPLREQLVAARNRFEALMEADREQLHRLAIQEGYRRQSPTGSSSSSLSGIDGSSSSAFVRLVRALLQRDGFQPDPPDGSGPESLVSTACQKDHKIFLHVHHSSGELSWKSDPTTLTGTPTLHASRLTAERHGSADVVVVTNGGFSLPAHRYAEEHRIWLLDRHDLLRWAVWGQPLECCGPHVNESAA